MRIAAIGIGTNSLHMIVVRVRPDLSFEVIDREKEMVRLGAGGLDGRALTPEAVQAGLQVRAKFRDSGAAQTGIRPQVISGTEEARLIHLAAVYGVGLPSTVAVVVDIGG